jgi:hypothetical protein
MKSHVVKPEIFVYKPRNDMLRSVILHLAKSLVKADLTVHSSTHREGFIKNMIYDSLLLINAKHGGAAKKTRIAGLTALLREKGSGIK